MPLVPYVVERSGREERVFDIYSRLLKDRIIFLQGAIDDTSANCTCGALPFTHAVKVSLTIGWRQGSLDEQAELSGHTRQSP